MNTKRGMDLVSRYLSGDALTQAEQQWLIDWLEQHPDQRDELLTDEATESLLQNLFRLDHTTDKFVQATLKRIMSPPPPTRHANSTAADKGNCKGAEWDDSAGEAFKIELRPALRNPSSSNGHNGTGSPVRNFTWPSMCALVLLICLGGGALVRIILTSHSTQEVASKPERTDQANDTDWFATVVYTDNAAWDQPRQKGDRLGPGSLRLTRGVAEVRFDKGTSARLTAPAEVELVSGDEVSLGYGKLTARVPVKATGFTVTTPVGRVVDVGTEFDVSVNESGTTEARVLDGKVLVLPQRTGELAGKSIELTPDQLDRVVMSVPEVAAPLLPVSTVASSRSGRFFGAITANGETLEFDSPSEFQEYQAKVNTLLGESALSFREEWSVMVESSSKRAVEGASSSQAGSRSSVHVRMESGRAFQAESQGDSMSESLDARQMLRDQLQQLRQEQPNNAPLHEMLDGMLRNLDESE